jgi:hypothetical protein
VTEQEVEIAIFGIAALVVLYYLNQSGVLGVANSAASQLNQGIQEGPGDVSSDLNELGNALVGPGGYLAEGLDAIGGIFSDPLNLAM